MNEYNPDETIKRSAELLATGHSVAQGDVTLRPVDEIPEGLELQKPEDHRLILAHSETGHHHAIAYRDDVDVYDQDELTSYVHNRSDNVVILSHFRNFDTHAPIGIPPGQKAKIIRGREYTPEGWRRSAD